MTNGKKCEPSVLSQEEKRKRREQQLDQIDVAISNVISATENQAQSAFISDTEQQIQQKIKQAESISAIENPPSKTNPQEQKEPKEFIPSVNVEISPADQLPEPAISRTEYNLPRALVEEVITNPVLDESLLNDLDDLVIQTKIIDPCDPEVLANRIKEFKELGKEMCFPVAPSSEEKKAQRDKILTSVAALILSNSGNPESSPQIANIQSTQQSGQVNTGIRPEDVDTLIQKLIPDSNLISAGESQRCIGKIQAAVEEIKQHNEFVKEELELLGERVVNFFALMVSFDYQLHVLLLYAKRYNIESYTDLITTTLGNIEQLLEEFPLPDLLDEDNQFDSQVANTYRDFLLEQIGFWRTQIRNLQPSGVTANQNNIAGREKEASDAFDNIPPLLQDDFSRISDPINIHNIRFFTNLEDRNGRLTDLLEVMSREPTQREIDEDTYFENLMQETTDYLQGTLFPVITDQIRTESINAAQIVHPVLKYRRTQNDLRNKFIEIRDLWLPFIESVINTYEISDLQSQKEKAVEILHQVECGGQPIIGLEVPENEPCNTVIDLGWKTFPVDEETDVKNLKYWQCFQETLNKVALLPQFYSIGLIIPTPGGIIRVPLPVKWIPLAVIPTQASIIVIWLTINGIVVSPTIWIWRFKPLGDGQSDHLQLFRGGNQNIKQRTRTIAVSNTIVGGLDTNPELTKIQSVYTEDDIPVNHRMSQNNLPWVNYLNRWCSTAKPYMGFI